MFPQNFLSIKLHYGCELGGNPSTPSHSNHEQSTYEELLSGVQMGDPIISPLSEAWLARKAPSGHQSVPDALIWIFAFLQVGIWIQEPKWYFQLYGVF